MRCVVVTGRAADIERLCAAAGLIELAGIEETPDGEVRLWPADEGDAVMLCERLRQWQPRLDSVPDGVNWNESWQRGWQPMEVGRRFYLVPPWDGESATPAGRLRLAMHPGTAFGNGDHPATHLCLAAMEDELKAGDVFLDIGCGSGLLGEAAMLLGARQAWGCDVTPGLGSFTGSVDAVRSASCDYVAANIQLGVLIGIADGIRRVLRPGGRAVLSGVLAEQAGELAAAARGSGLAVMGRAEQQGWAALRVARAQGEEAS